MPSIFFALISFIGWGIGDIFNTIAARRLDAYSATFWTLIWAFLISSLYVPFALKELANLTGPLFIMIMLLGVFFLVGITFFREAVRKNNPSLAVAIAGSFPALTTILSLIFFQEALLPIQALLVIVIFVGISLCVFDLQNILQGKIRADKYTALALVPFFAWGILFTFMKIPVRAIGWFWPYYMLLGLFPLLYFFMRFRGIKLQSPRANGAFIPLVLTTILIRSADFSFNAGINLGHTAIVAPIAAGNLALFVLIASFVFKDPITKQQIAGIVTTLIGIVLLSFVSA